jgi:hypothetical protein
MYGCNQPISGISDRIGWLGPTFKNISDQPQPQVEDNVDL